MKNSYYVIGNEVYIKLNRDKFPNCWTVIDLEDFDKVNSYEGTWCVIDNKLNLYAYQHNRGFVDMLHRIICKLPREDALEPDHINSNGLDNRKENLQIVTGQQNKHLTVIRKNLGLYWVKKEARWYAQISINKIYYVKRTKDKLEALKIHKLLNLLYILSNLSGIQIGERDDQFALSFCKNELDNQTYETIIKQTPDFRERIFFNYDKKRWIVSPTIVGAKRPYKSFKQKSLAIKYAEDLMDLHIPTWRATLC